MNKEPTLWFTRSNGTVRGPFTDSVIRNNILLGRLDPLKDKVSTDQLNWYPINSQDQLYTDYNTEAAIQTKLNLDERDGFDRRHSLSATQATPHNRIDDRRKDEDKHDIQRRQFRTLLMHKFRQREERTFWPLIAIFSLLAAIFILAFSYAKPFPTPQSNCEHLPSAGVNWTNCLKPQVNLENVKKSAKLIRKNSKIPIGVGFGIRSRSDVSKVVQISDAAIVGSGIVEIIGNGVKNKISGLDLAINVGQYLKELREGLLKR